ncbi:MAG: hypothetical protein AAB509_00750 [Patescibacteria group bacterium]
MTRLNKTFAFFLLIVCYSLFLHIHFGHAATLEVDYPEISNYDPNLDTQLQLPQYLKYVFDFGIFIGFFAVLFSLIWAGVLYLLSPIIPNAIADAKDKVSGAISGLLILATLYLIITTINPELKFFRLNPLEPIPPPPAPEQQAGVYLYKSNDCSGDRLILTTSSTDLGQSFNNQVNSINIINNPKQDIYHVVILYNTNNNRGRCMYMVKTGCQQIRQNNFGVVSASVFRYDFSPSGNGVFFYGRGGHCKIDNSKIKGIFASNLSDLYLTNLSDCADDTLRCGDKNSKCTTGGENCICKQWTQDGSCEKERYCPNLAGENVSGIKLDGNYIAVLVYFGPQDPARTGPWTDCQAYPVPDDVNKIGGIIKWDAIRNNNYGRLPNWMFILPVKQK